MDITGARWGLEGAEAILKLRAVIANGDFEDYWRFHSAASTNVYTTPDTATTSSSQRKQLTSKEPHPSHAITRSSIASTKPVQQRLALMSQRAEEGAARTIR